MSRYSKILPAAVLAAGIFSILFSLVLVQLCFGILALLWLTEKNSEKIKAFDAASLIFLIFIGLRLLSVFLSDYPDLSWHALYKDALFYFSFFFLSFYLRTFDESELKRIAFFLIISLTAVALTGLIRFNFGDVKRAETFTGGYTSFSAYLMAGSGIILAYIKPLKGKKLYLYSLAAGLIYTGIITSHGRFNIISAVILLIAGSILLRHKIKTIMLLIIFTAVLSYISLLNNSEVAEERINSPAQLSDRDIIYEGAFHLWKEKPLTGFGPRTFSEIFPFKDRLTDKGVSSWHNDFLQVYFESGILCLITFMLLLGYLLLKGIRHILQNIKGNNYILVGIFLALTGIILSALTAGFINSPVLSVFFSFLTAFMLAGINNSNYSRVKENGNYSS